MKRKNPGGEADESQSKRQRNDAEQSAEQSAEQTSSSRSGVNSADLTFLPLEELYEELYLHLDLVSLSYLQQASSFFNRHVAESSMWYKRIMRDFDISPDAMNAFSFLLKENNVAVDFHKIYQRLHRLQYTWRAALEARDIPGELQEKVLFENFQLGLLIICSDSEKLIKEISWSNNEELIKKEPLKNPLILLAISVASHSLNFSKFILANYQDVSFACLHIAVRNNNVNYFEHFFYDKDPAFFDDYVDELKELLDDVSRFSRLAMARVLIEKFVETDADEFDELSSRGGLVNAAVSANNLEDAIYFYKNIRDYDNEISKVDHVNLIMLGCRYGNIALMEEMFKEIEDVAGEIAVDTGNDHAYMLYAAAESGHVNVLRHLIENRLESFSIEITDKVESRLADIIRKDKLDDMKDYFFEAFGHSVDDRPSSPTMHKPY